MRSSIINNRSLYLLLFYTKQSPQQYLPQIESHIVFRAEIIEREEETARKNKSELPPLRKKILVTHESHIKKFDSKKAYCLQFHH